MPLDTARDDESAVQTTGENRIMAYSSGGNAIDAIRDQKRLLLRPARHLPR
ncbi:MAG: hypothetical protein H7145_06510 [Akkermansiaceae bacterium]|nr:hypothetical protein [Armatimonadota bacterium]